MYHGNTVTKTYVGYLSNDTVLRSSELIKIIEDTEERDEDYLIVFAFSGNKKKQ